MTSEAESAALSDLIGHIYDASLDPNLWIRTLERICGFVGGSSAVLFWHDAATARSEALYLFNEDPHYTKLYFEKYLAMNPLFPAGAFTEPGVIYTPTDLVPESELVKTRFHKEWTQPQGIVDVLGVNLEKGTTASSLIAIRRTAEQGIADAGARERLALLIPHLQRAVVIGRLFDQAAKTKDVLTETLDQVEAGVFLVGTNGEIAFANDPGRLILEEGTLLLERRQVLTAVSPEANRMLRDILAASERGDMSVGGRGVAIPLSISPHQQWFAHVLPLTSGDRQRSGALHSAAAAVFVRKTSPVSPPPLEALAKLYKLTASELRVLDALTKVSSVKAASELLGISQATVKTHLHNLFRKTGTSRQSELVKLIAGFGQLRSPA